MDKETIIYKEKKYVRYPKSKSSVCRNYYVNHKNKKHLHRDIYIDLFGEIPKGFVVHHMDGNTLNNSKENLSVMSRSAHAKLHATEQLLKNPLCFQKAITAAIAASAKWAKTDAGSKAIRERTRKYWASVKCTRRICSVCGVSYVTKWKSSKYCNNICRRKSKDL